MPKQGSIRGVSIWEPATQCTIESACDTATGALWDAVDLLLIHNEGPAGAEAPRGVLSPVVVLLAVSAWERFVYELANATGVEVKAKETVGGFSGKQLDKTLEILQAASETTLPGAFTVTVYDAPFGKSLKERQQLRAAGEDRHKFYAELNSYIELRNGVAHRVVPLRMDEQSFRSDAGRDKSQRWRGHTVNTSIARMVIAAYLQLIDQAIVHVCRAQGLGYAEVSQRRLPSYWFTDDRSATDSFRTWRPGCLWGGVSLPRIP